MASLQQRLTDNVRGRFYVDSSCIDCHLCASLSPGLFMAMEGQGYCIVHRQPATDLELTAALQAAEYCPVGAIGGDGYVEWTEIKRRN